MTGLNFEDYNKDQELVVLTKLDTIAVLKIFGLWDFVLRNWRTGLSDLRRPRKCLERLSRQRKEKNNG